MPQSVCETTDQVARDAERNRQLLTNEFAARDARADGGAIRPLLRASRGIPNAPYTRRGRAVDENDQRTLWWSVGGARVCLAKAGFSTWIFRIAYRGVASLSRRHETRTQAHCECQHTIADEVDDAPERPKSSAGPCPRPAAFEHARRCNFLLAGASARKRLR